MTTFERREPPNAYHLAAVVGAVSLVIAGVASATGLWQTALWPFVWIDLATLCWLCCLPIAASAWSMTRGGFRRHFSMLLVSSFVLLCLPLFFLQVKIANQARRAQELVAQSRFGEAKSLLKQIVLLRPNATWQGVHLSQASTRLQAVIEPIAARVAQPLPPAADSAQKLHRARDLAMLGQTDGALQLLADSVFTDHPEALVLRGSIDEANQRWRLASDGYTRASQLLSRQTNESATTNNPVHAKALAGIGYCERKRGHLPQAEAAYTRLLAVAPTAESYFLVAQFYEDTQQTALASTYARRAAELAPSEFQQRAHLLEARLTTSHFGCLTAFWNRPASHQGLREPWPRQ